MGYMKKNKYYKVELYSVDLELEKHMGLAQKKEYDKGTNIIEILKKCQKKEVATVIVYKTVMGKFKEIITKREIPALFFSYSVGYEMTKKIPLFFTFKFHVGNHIKYEELENLQATPKDINDYLYENLKKPSEDSNYYSNCKKDFEKKLDLLFDNAINEYLELVDYLNVYDSSLEKLNSDKVKKIRKEYKI